MFRFAVVFPAVAPLADPLPVVSWLPVPLVALPEPLLLPFDDGAMGPLPFEPLPLSGVPSNGEPVGVVDSMIRLRAAT